MSNSKTNGGSELLNNLMVHAGIAGEVKGQHWTDLDNLYEDIGKGILQVGCEINDAVSTINSNLEIFSNEDKEEISVSIRGLSQDLESFATDLSAIKKMHSGRKGIVSEEDYGLSLEIFNNYVILNDRFKALIFPTVLTITEKMLLVKANAEKQSLADPTVISDVQAKEVVNHE